ncbi:MAG: nitrous oxide reductase family maturation protein NosD [Candidatus Kapabacteria bacterium]|nr:nitrous oxide reductase family maturation protein NosD [Candidatus Kapabacteria bacterium]MDW7996403.1 nitrous oxide reductase family maturation protein NosD [Bacteroidota bacterium]MDW8224865.1 nitrous oxide reductase family maturation protein NosD [Bacteroidota bacterium]
MARGRHSSAWHLFGCLAVVLASHTPAASERLLVGHGGFPTLQAALAQARAGDTVHILPGVYREREIDIWVPLVIEASPGATLDGEGAGEILRVRASGTVIRGLTFRRSGVSFLRENAAIRIEGAHDCRIERNRLEGCFFGIYLSKSARCVVQYNVILGTAEREATSGNGIHLWYCRDILVRGNHVVRHRDGIYFEFVRHSTVEHNVSEDNLRYGIHFMFSDSCSYRFNLFQRNSAGVAVMYSRFILMENNRFEHNWGESTFGLLLKDISQSHVRRNVFLSNTTALYLEGSNHNLVDSNRFHANGWALRLMASATGNTFIANSFVANTVDATTNSTLSFNTFRANYWDRYRGYDIDRDGYGDVPFHPVSAFGILTERFPALLLFLRSFIAELWELAEQVFPVLTPMAIVDPTPLLEPPA